MHIKQLSIEHSILDERSSCSSLGALQFHSKRLSVPMETIEDQTEESGSPSSHTPQAWVVRANRSGRITGVDVIDMSPKGREAFTFPQSPGAGSDSLRSSPRGSPQVGMAHPASSTPAPCSHMLDSQFLT